MKSPFDSAAFDKAGAPMFDEAIVVSGIRNGVARRQTLTVSVFDDATDSDPIGETSLDTDVETIRCVARSADWRFVRDQMVRGDTVKRPCGAEYQITKIGHDSVMGWVISARQVK